MKIAVEEWELYNNGVLLCKWFDTEIDSFESIQAFVSEEKEANGLKSNDLEMFVADVEGETLGLMSGDESVEWAYALSETIGNLTEDDMIGIGLMIEEGIASDINGAIEYLDDMNSTGESSMEDIAYNYINDCGLLDNIPESLKGYFDYESLGRDMDIEGQYMKDENGIIWEYVA